MSPDIWWEIAGLSFVQIDTNYKTSLFLFGFVALLSRARRWRRLVKQKPPGGGSVRSAYDAADTILYFIHG